MNKFLKSLLCPREYPELPVKDSYIAILDDMANVLFYVQSHNDAIKKSSVDNMYKARIEREKFKIGTRVYANSSAGFHKGVEGVIEYVEPTGNCWVLRDGATTAVYYKQHELDILPRKQQNTDITGPR
jgi:hypothetical protein